MNHTTEDSKLQVVYGIQSIFAESGRVEVPKDKEIVTEGIVESSLAGMELTVKDNSEEHEKYMKTLSGFKANRDARRTKPAYERRMREGNLEQR